MTAKRRYIVVFAGCMGFVVAVFLVCVFFEDLLRRPVLQKSITFVSPAAAKYARDGNVYATRDYENALQRFEKVVAADPGDACAAICLTKTKRRLENPKLPSVFMFDKK